MPADPLKVVAHGEQPVWESEREHPVHGKLTFKAGLPTARQLARHSVEMDNLLADLGEAGDPRPGTMVLVAAIAGIGTLVEPPVVSEKREEDEDGNVRVAQVRYDASEETRTDFLVDLWMEYSQWRADFLERVDELGNSSRGTNGSGSSEPSTATTASPTTTPA